MTEPTICVAVPGAADADFSYTHDTHREVAPGMRVLVPFGPRVLLGVVRPLVAKVPAGVELRSVLDVVDPRGRPALPPDVLDLCEWIVRYYLAPPGEVYRLALPGLLTQTDARRVFATPAGAEMASRMGQGPLLAGWDAERLSEGERRVLAAVVAAEPSGASLAELAKLRPRVTAVARVVASLEDQSLCRTDFEVGTNARTEIHVRRTDYLRGASADESALRTLIGRSKQRRALLDYLEGQGDEWVGVSELRGPFPRVKTLLEPLFAAKLVLGCERPRYADPFAGAAPVRSQPSPPTAEQAAALDWLREQLDQRVFAQALLHGVTGSGKTEVYLQLIAAARAQDGAAIVLVPEISLTPQLADRFRSRFGDTVAVLHSGLTPRQRYDAWEQIRTGQRRIVIGARSAVFAPVENLRVIVVDEEHDSSFKQEEGVRYHARDVALVRARAAAAVAVLGSATPSLETYQRAREGRIEWLRLRTRPTPRPLPKVEVVSLKVHRPDPHTQLTARLRDAVCETVAAGEQVIIFLNRRGYTTGLVCRSCGAMQACPDCSAPAMTYHLSRNRLLCHLCGHVEATPTACSACGSQDLIHSGAGTERVELALIEAFAEFRVLRLDRDASRGRRLLTTLQAFRDHQADILVGTQMLAKGHDFPGVTLVGIVAADQGLSMPDPRAAERSFQLLTQVAGRAGRGERAGRVILQTWAPSHPAVARAAEHDFEGFAELELADRRDLGNPPFGHLALVRFVGADELAVERVATACARRLRAHLRDTTEVRLLGPVAAPIARINRRTRWQLLLRAKQRAPLHGLLRWLRRQRVEAHGVRVGIDVDPQSLL
ncbi:MAG: primosomal protein N' [Myxococcales bacterium FL481]|nr:MAG: primosomal protein N' [Myxococcales bacterium FL481]